MNRTSAHVWLTIIGALATIAFFLPFLDIGGLVSLSGLEIVLEDQLPWFTRIVVALVPVMGITLFLAAVTGSTSARPIAGMFGFGVLGYLAYLTIKFFVATTGFGLWLVIGCAIVALVSCVLASD